MDNKEFSKDAEEFKSKLLSKFPKKIAKKRAKSMVLNEAGVEQEIQSNVRTVPGIISQRGCTYAGCKGVVLGPTRDVINLTHGPIGCGFYSWLTRRNQTDPGTDGENYIPYCFSTDMEDQNIVFGGEKKLLAAIHEAYELFKPKAIAIFSTCPVGLIGDDVHAVSRQAKKELPGVNVFGFSCEGYKGVSQSAGHHIANNGVFKNLIGNSDKKKEGKYVVNLLGEYNIGGDAWAIEEVFEKCGITIQATFSGDSSIPEFEAAHMADLNMVMCHRSINYIAEMMETKYGIPWIKVNFVGANDTCKSLRKIADYFGDKELSAKVEEVIAAEMAKIEAVLAEVTKTTTGKLAMVFVGGSRAHSYQKLFSELGMKTMAAGYEFAHRDDYEGRDVLPTIKVDADSRNIEELHVEADPEKFAPRKTDAELAEYEKAGYKFKDYEGMKPDMDDQTWIIDDISHYESEELIKKYKPDVFCAGIKEKYAVQKMGVPMKQLHSYDYGGPYASFSGAINFYKDIEMMVGSDVWSMVKAPWENEPSLVGCMAVDA